MLFRSVLGWNAATDVFKLGQSPVEYVLALVKHVFH